MHSTNAFGLKVRRYNNGSNYWLLVPTHSMAVILHQVTLANFPATSRDHRCRQHFFYWHALTFVGLSFLTMFLFGNPHRPCIQNNLSEELDHPLHQLTNNQAYNDPYLDVILDCRALVILACECFFQVQRICYYWFWLVSFGEL